MPDDSERINFGIAQAESEGRLLDHATIRAIAALLHGGQTSSYYLLTSSGAIDHEGLAVEMGRDLNNPDLDPECKRWIGHLITYAEDSGDRQPVHGWSSLWPEDSPETADAGYGPCAVCSEDMPAGSNPHTYEEDGERNHECHGACCPTCNPEDGDGV
jgi:hypothetical protein